MKAAKIVGWSLGGLFAVVAIAVVVFYIGWLRAPEATEVCGNIAKVLKSETGIDLPEKAKTDCIAQASTKPMMRGQVPWVQELKCMRDAKSQSELDGCSKKN